MSRSDPASGFTLLEVLAAVALLGILFTVLAGIAIQGLRTEGESRRRLDASLIADRQLVDLEAELDAGLVPPIGTTESEQGDFRVAVEVRPFEAPPELREGEAGGSETAEGGGLPSLLSSGEDSEGAVRAIEVRVSWSEGGEERSVVRTTFGIDLLAAAAPAGSPGAGVAR